MTDSTASVTYVPISVDYTNRDFYSLRADMITRVKDRVPGWVGSDPSDFGLALIEAFSYMGDIVGYYVDRVANEGTLLTASQRSSVINLAQTYGYNPAGYQAATCTLRVSNTAPASYTIPAKSVVYGNFVDGDVTRQIKFSTQADVTVNPTKTITGASRPSGSTSLALTSVGHGFANGSSIYVSGLTNGSSAYNNAAYTISTTATVTAASGNGTTVTYTAANNYVANQVVTITGLTTTTGASLNLAGVTINTASSTQFTVLNGATGTATATQSGLAATPDSFVITTAATTLIGPDAGLTGSAVYNNGSSATVSAIHGYYITSKNPVNSGDSQDIAGELIGQSTGAPSQVFTLVEAPVVDKSVRVFVKNGTAYSEWQYVLHLSDYGPNDLVFTTFYDANDYVTVLFGDGVNGAIPPRGGLIKSEYLVGGGVIGNIPLASVDPTTGVSTLGLTHWFYALGYPTISVLSSVVSVINTTIGSGGADPDSISMIKALAPLSFASLNRAVTLDDYTSLALQVPTIGKANAIAATSASVTLYVAPRQGPTIGDPYPLYFPPTDNHTAPSILTSKWDAGDGATGLKYDAINALTPKLQIGVSLTVLPPVYVLTRLGITYTPLPNYTNAQVEAQLTALLDAYYSYSFLSFGQTVYPGDIELLLRYAPGVANIKVTALYRDGNTIAPSILVGQPNEIFIITTPSSGSSSTTTLTAANSNTALATLAIAASSGTPTLSPTFSQTFYNYNIATALAANTVTITPTVTDTAPSSTLSTIYVNDVVTASGTGAVINVANASVTASGVSGNGTSMTYTANNAFKVGQLVTVTGASIAGYNVTNAVITSMVGTLGSYTGFTVAGTATGTPTGTIVAIPTTVATIRVIAQDGTTLSTYTASITKS